jgi:hypothetical protein
MPQAASGGTAASTECSKDHSLMLLLPDMMALEFAFGDIPGPFVSFVVPSLLFEEVSVRKPSGEFPKPPLSPSPAQ